MKNLSIEFEEESCVLGFTEIGETAYRLSKGVYYHHLKEGKSKEYAKNQAMNCFFDVQKLWEKNANSTSPTLTKQ